VSEAPVILSMSAVDLDADGAPNHLSVRVSVIAGMQSSMKGTPFDSNLPRNSNVILRVPAQIRQEAKIFDLRRVVSWREEEHNSAELD
jgi:hypothetical protein